MWFCTENQENSCRVFLVELTLKKRVIVFVVMGDDFETFFFFSKNKICEVACIFKKKFWKVLIVNGCHTWAIFPFHHDQYSEILVHLTFFNHWGFHWTYFIFKNAFLCRILWWATWVSQSLWIHYGVPFRAPFCQHSFL